MGVADRVDPLAGVAGAVEPVCLRRLHLDHALHRADGQRERAGGDELPQMPERLRNPHEPRLEDREADVGGEAPVAEAHHTRADPDRHLVPLAQVRLRHLVVPAVLDEPADRDPVGDERDIEDEQSNGREPKRTLGEAFARERASDDAWQHPPAQPGGEQRAAADDHHVRVRQVAHEVSRVAGAGEPLGGPGEVLEHHVHAAEDQEAAAGHEVLAQAAVVPAELLFVVRLSSHGCRRTG